MSFGGKKHGRCVCYKIMWSLDFFFHRIRAKFVLCCFRSLNIYTKHKHWSASQRQLQNHTVSFVGCAVCQHETVCQSCECQFSCAARDSHGFSSDIFLYITVSVSQSVMCVPWSEKMQRLCVVYTEAVQKCSIFKYW